LPVSALLIAAVGQARLRCAVPARARPREVGGHASLWPCRRPRPAAPETRSREGGRLLRRRVL